MTFETIYLLIKLYLVDISNSFIVIPRARSLLKSTGKLLQAHFLNTRYCFEPSKRCPCRLVQTFRK